MTRLIDVDALWEELGILYHQNNGKVNWNDALLEIKNAPTIEPEQKKGKWIPDNLVGGGYWVCSTCKHPTEAFGANKIYKWCPFCGAKMGGEE